MAKIYTIEPQNLLSRQNKGDKVLIVPGNENDEDNDFYLFESPGEGSEPTNGTSQVETATVGLDQPSVGTGGVVAVVITSALFPGDRTYLVPIPITSGAEDVALEIRENAELIADLAGLFTVSGTDADIILTADVRAENDSTLNIAIGGTGTTATDITPNPTSVSTTAGVAATPGKVGRILVESGFLYVVSSVDNVGNPTWEKVALSAL